MQFFVRIVFSGLIAFAMQEDHKDAMLIIPNLTSSHHGGHGMRSMIHLPFLQIPCAALADSSTKAACERGKIPGLDSGFCKDGILSGLMCIPLNHYDISLRPGGVAATLQSLNVKYKIRKEGEKFHTNADNDDFDWVVDANKILSTPKLVNRGLVTEPIDAEFEGFVIGRARLENGTLHSNIVESSYGAWLFKTENSYTVDYSQEAATEVWLDSNFANNFVLRIADFAGNVIKDLKLKGITAGVPVTMAITNEPSLEEFCNFEYLARVYHFSHLYKFLGFGENADLPVPKIVQRPKVSCREKKKIISSSGNSGGGRLPVICMGSQMSAPPIPLWREP